VVELREFLDSLQRLSPAEKAENSDMASRVKSFLWIDSNG
jgi:hypothetical protein